MMNVRGEASGWGLGTSGGAGSGEQLLVLHTSDHMGDPRNTSQMQIKDKLQLHAVVSWQISMEMWNRKEAVKFDLRRGEILWLGCRQAEVESSCPSRDFSANFQIFRAWLKKGLHKEHMCMKSICGTVLVEQNVISASETEPCSEPCGFSPR